MWCWQLYSLNSLNSPHGFSSGFSNPSIRQGSICGEGGERGETILNAPFGFSIIIRKWLWVDGENHEDQQIMIMMMVKISMIHKSWLWWWWKSRRSKQTVQVKLDWVSELSMKVVFPDGSSDLITLSTSSNIPGEATPCLFSGALDGDQDSLVSVSGCRNQDEISVTIVSRKVANGLVDLSVQGEKTFQIRLNFPTWREDDGLAAPN